MTTSQVSSHIQGRRVRLAALTVITAAALLTSAACHASGSGSGTGSLTGTVASGAPSEAVAAASASPAATATVTASPGTGSGSTSGPAHTGTVHVTVSVHAVRSSYTGLCPPPASATRYRAVISVNHGPATVTYRWTSSNGGDTDPSAHTVTFGAGGAQSRTFYHNEAFYPPSPYPATISDWIGIDVSAPAVTHSNHAPITIKCVPVTVVASGVVTSYSGVCPPPDNTPQTLMFAATLTVKQPVTITYRWQTSNGGDSDPSTHTLDLVPGTPVVLKHHELGFLPGETMHNWAALDVTAGSYSVQSNHVPFTMTCS